jgi:hypothetical protein
MRKKPLFLLEIVIAIFLVGIFSVYFLRSSIHYLYQERTALLDLEFERLRTVRIMDAISAYWNTVEALHQSKSQKEIADTRQLEVCLGNKTYARPFKLEAGCSSSHEQAYVLTLQEKKKQEEKKPGKKDQKKKDKEKPPTYSFLIQKPKPEIAKAPEASGPTAPPELPEKLPDASK